MRREEAIERLRSVIRRMHLSLSTEDAYVLWVSRFIAFLRSQPVSASSEQKLEAFLSKLARQDVAASTQNQAFNALLFFYTHVLGQKLGDVHALRAKRAATIRRAPSVEEVRALLSAVHDHSGYPVRLVVRMLYACGLRVTEPLGLRVRDVRLSDSMMIIRQAKGAKDRVVSVPCALAAELTAQLETAKAVWRKDVAAGVPIKLPHQIAQKYPRAQASWDWAWVFPQVMPCRDPRDGRVVRWHMLESVVQRAVRRSSASIGTTILPHELRHSYATHTLNRGCNPRALQQAMGHKSLETTMGYLHAEALSVPSPLSLVS